MLRFILITFAFLGWAFYELSGGSDFDPQNARLTNVTTDPLKVSEPTPAPEAVEVTRVALNLTSVDDVLVSKQRPKVALPQQPVAQNASLTVEQGGSVTILPSLVAGVDPAQEVAPEPRFSDIRTVSGNRVNVRGGPGTGFGIVNKLQRGDEVVILEDDGSGWVRLRPVDGGPVGWMADFLLSQS